VAALFDKANGRETHPESYDQGVPAKEVLGVELRASKALILMKVSLDAWHDVFRSVILPFSRKFV
jgi:hypothetical protein